MCIARKDRTEDLPGSVSVRRPDCESVHRRTGKGRLRAVGHYRIRQDSTDRILQREGLGRRRKRLGKCEKPRNSITERQKVAASMGQITSSGGHRLRDVPIIGAPVARSPTAVNRRPLLLALAPLLLVACNRAGDSPDSPQSGPEAAAPEPPLVRTEPLATGAVEKRLQVTANIASLDVVSVFAERTDLCLEVLVEEGDAVEAGQTLARLREVDPQLALAEAAVRCQETHEELLRAERDHERNTKLAAEQGLTTGILSERDLEASLQAVVTARTAHETATLAKSRAFLDVERSTIVSPIAGTISSREVSVGNTVGPSARLFEITDLSRPVAIFYRPQRELAALSVGQPLTVLSEALPAAALDGRIERIAPTIDPTSGTVKVTARIEPPEDVRIPTGILVQVDLLLDRHEQALLLPKRGLLYDGDRPYCFVVRGTTAIRVPLEIGYETEQEIEILPQDELVEGEEVVVLGADRLHDGIEVRLAEPFATPLEASSTETISAGD